MKLLHIDSSVLAEHSVSRQLTARIVTEWQATHPGTAVEYLDLAQDTPATLSGAELAARMTPADSRSAEQTAAAARTEAFLQQFLAADGAPEGKGAALWKLR